MSDLRKEHWQFRGLFVLLLVGVMGATGCASRGEQSDLVTADPDVINLIDLDAVPKSFYVCHGYGCQQQSLIGMAKKEWQAIDTLFRTPAGNAIEERQRIASAIALFERAAGRKTGTSGDIPKTPFSIYDNSQLDCVDESINTSTYLKMLERFGLLRWHRTALPVRRGTPLFFNIHFTGTVVEMESGVRYAVDSWFFANGEKPSILPAKTWQAGWHPNQATLMAQ